MSLFLKLTKGFVQMLQHMGMEWGCGVAGGGWVGGTPPTENKLSMLYELYRVRAV